MRRIGPLAVIAALAMSFAAPLARAASIIDGDFSAGGVTEVPPGWTANAGFMLEPRYNTVTDNPALVPAGGSYALSIGNFTWQSAPVLSQVISTQRGATYTVSFLAMAPKSDATSRLDVYVDALYGPDPYATPIGGTGLTVTGTLPYTLESFSFIGTGSDTLSIVAYNNPATYYVADVTIAGGIAGSVPEASSWALMIAGFACLGLFAARTGRDRTARLA